MVTYYARHGCGVQSPRRPDATKSARRIVQAGWANAERARGAAADDALRCDEAPEVARGGRSRRQQAARAREIALSEPGSDPARPRPLGEQVRRTMGSRTERPQAQTGEDDGEGFRNLHQDDARASLARHHRYRDAK